MGSLTTGSPTGPLSPLRVGLMYSLATVRVLWGRSELCPVGTGVTEKVTETYHSFFGLSSLLLVTMTGSGNQWGHHVWVALVGCGEHLG